MFGKKRKEKKREDKKERKSKGGWFSMPHKEKNIFGLRKDDGSKPYDSNWFDSDDE